MSKPKTQTETVQHQTQRVGCPAIAPAGAEKRRGIGGRASKLSVNLAERAALGALGLEHPHTRRDAHDLLHMVEDRRRRLTPLSGLEQQRITAATAQLIACRSPRLKYLGAKLSIGVQRLHLALWGADVAAAKAESRRTVFRVITSPETPAAASVRASGPTDARRPRARAASILRRFRPQRSGVCMGEQRPRRTMVFAAHEPATRDSAPSSTRGGTGGAP